MNQDWSEFLFSAQGAYPNILPVRFRITDNLSRYSNDVTLDDIHSAGYIGPIEVPIIKETEETLLWDSVAYCYRVIPLIDKKIQTHKNQVIDLKSQAANLLATKNNINNFVSVYSYINTYNSNSRSVFYSKLQEIIDTTYFFDDLPKLPLLQLMNQQNETELLNEYDTLLANKISSWKDTYEQYGVDESTLFVCASGMFTIPDSWVKGDKPYTSSV